MRSSSANADSSRQNCDNQQQQQINNNNQLQASEQRRSTHFRRRLHGRSQGQLTAHEEPVGSLRPRKSNRSNNANNVSLFDGLSLPTTGRQDQQQQQQHLGRRQRRSNQHKTTTSSVINTNNTQIINFHLNQSFGPQAASTSSSSSNLQSNQQQFASNITQPQPTRNSWFELTNQLMAASPSFAHFASNHRAINTYNGHINLLTRSNETNSRLEPQSSSSSSSMMQLSPPTTTVNNNDATNQVSFLFNASLHNDLANRLGAFTTTAAAAIINQQQQQQRTIMGQFGPISQPFESAARQSMHDYERLYRSLIINGRATNHMRFASSGLGAIDCAIDSRSDNATASSRSSRPCVVANRSAQLKQQQPTTSQIVVPTPDNNSNDARLGRILPRATIASKRRREFHKCRRVYGLERRQLWCTQCRWKKACSRFQRSCDLDQQQQTLVTNDTLVGGISSSSSLMMQDDLASSRRDNQQANNVRSQYPSNLLEQLALWLPPPPPPPTLPLPLPQQQQQQQSIQTTHDRGLSSRSKRKSSMQQQHHRHHHRTSRK